MRVIMILLESILAAAVIATAGCESLYEGYIPVDGENYIYLFRTENSLTGAMGGRAGADAICLSTYTSRYGRLGAKHVRVFLNVSTDDAIVKMPENFGVPVDAPVMGMNFTTGSLGGVLAASWDDLLDSSINMSLFNAGVYSGGANYWTGDTSGFGTTGLDGDLNCNGWTSSNTSLHGRTGDSVASGITWLSAASQVCDAPTVSLLCVAW
jgi:hypothetical protein